MGSAAGALKAAATRVGLGTNEYQDRINKGLLWCTRCQAWHPAEAFAIDRSRVMRGRAGSCRQSISAAARSSYVPRERPAKGRRHVEARDDDRKQARRRVNYLVEIGHLPNPNTLACLDCGHEGVDRRHEYDHHRGYAPEHHEDVEPVCSRCHHTREAKRNG